MPLSGSLAAVLFPDCCRLCERALRSLTPAPVCQSCLDSLQAAESSFFCQCCGLPFESAAPLHGTEECGLCRLRVWDFDRVRGFGAYEGDLRRLIHLLKYDKMRPLARPLAERMAARLPELGLADILIPVPLYRWRRWQRGFNQAEALAQELSSLSGIPCSRKVLRRTRPTRPQVGLSNRERRLNLAGAFDVSSPQFVSGRRVLLVDDVMTTGATLDACARALKAAGAVWVAGLTAARAKRRYIEISESSTESVVSFGGGPKPQ
jgi:ComF family protein